MNSVGLDLSAYTAKPWPWPHWQAAENLRFFARAERRYKKQLCAPVAGCRCCREDKIASCPNSRHRELQRRRRTGRRKNLIFQKKKNFLNPKKKKKKKKE